MSFVMAMYMSRTLGTPKRKVKFNFEAMGQFTAGPFDRFGSSWGETEALPCVIIPVINPQVKKFGQFGRTSLCVRTCYLLSRVRR